MKALAVLGLGSNEGDRLQHLSRAVAALGRGALPVLSHIVLSPVYESRALLPAGAPQSWDSAFLNMAVAGETALSPQALLAEVKEMETKLGRRPRGFWGPREIDIDILAYGDTVLDAPDLRIPHRELLLRDFALVPFADVAPDWAYPCAGEYNGVTAKQMVRALGMKPGADLVRTHHTV